MCARSIGREMDSGNLRRYGLLFLLLLLQPLGLHLKMCRRGKAREHFICKFRKHGGLPFRVVSPERESVIAGSNNTQRRRQKTLPSHDYVADETTTQSVAATTTAATERNVLCVRTVHLPLSVRPSRSRPARSRKRAMRIGESPFPASDSSRGSVSNVRNANAGPDRRPCLFTQTIAGLSLL